MRRSHPGLPALVALVVLTACTASPSSSTSPSAAEPSIRPTPAADALELLIDILEDPAMGFTATFTGSTTSSNADDASTDSVVSTVSGTLDVSGDDFRGTYEAAGDIAYVAGQVNVGGTNYLSMSDGPWIEDLSAGNFPTVREALLAILGANDGAEAALDGQTITIEPGPDTCTELLRALLLIDSTFDVTESGPCRLELEVSGQGEVEQMAVEAATVLSVGEVGMRLGFDVVYAIEDFGEPVEIAPPSDPWSTYAWTAGALQIGHPAGWLIEDADVNPILVAAEGDRIVGIIGGLVDGAAATPENAVALAEQLMAEKYGIAPEAREAVRGGTVDGTLLLSRGALGDGELHSYMAAALAHPSGRIYVIEFIGLPGREVEDEAFFRTMLSTLLFGG